VRTRMFLAALLSLAGANTAYAVPMRAQDIAFAAPIVSSHSSLPGDVPFGSIVYDNTAGSFMGLSASGNWLSLGSAITGVTAGTGLTGGGSSGNVTLNANVGTGPNQIVQLDGSGKLPAVDGSQLTNISGGITTGTQTFSGSKTFLNQVSFGVNPGPFSMPLSAWAPTNNYVAWFGSPSGAATDPGVAFFLNHDVSTGGPTFDIRGVASDYGTYNDIRITAHQNLHVGTRFVMEGPVPAMTVCGNVPLIQGTDGAGHITVGNDGTASSCTFNFASAWPNPPVCVVNNSTDSNNAAYKVSTTTTSMTFTAPNPFTAASTFQYICLGL